MLSTVKPSKPVSAVSARLGGASTLIQVERASGEVATRGSLGGRARAFEGRAGLNFLTDLVVLRARGSFGLREIWC